MALINCTECGNEVSDKASACPKCGAPIEKQQEHTVHGAVNSEPKKTPLEQPKEKKRSIWKIIVPILFVMLLAFTFIIIQNNPNAMPGVKLEINPPSPIVITSRADQSKSTLFKLKTTVHVSVQNQGGDGNVLVTFSVSQAGNNYRRSQSVFMRSQESMDLNETFTEVKMLDGKVSYDVNVRAE